MKRVDLVRELEGLGAVFARHGGSHDIYELKGQILVVPRHREINEITAQKILRKARSV